MTMDNPPAARPATNASALSSGWYRSRPWLAGALLLAGAAQLITISALTSVDPVPATWSALLLATAPAPLAAAARFTPAPGNRLAAAAALVVIIVGAAGQIGHTGLFFVPALIALVGAAVGLWRERSSARGGAGR